MQENLLNKKKENNLKNAEKYAVKYFTDLQKHFNLTDLQLLKLIKNCGNRIKKDKIKKKWWQFF